jgi:enamine deaminase RidA (YjgF/YER057c/UK114 family)
LTIAIVNGVNTDRMQEGLTCSPNSSMKGTNTYLSLNSLHQYRNLIMSITRSHTNARMSQLVIHDNTVYLSGQVASDATANVTVQTQQVLDKIDSLLAEAGSDKARILSAQIWLANIGHFSAMNEVWDAWVSEGNAPARACIEARLASPDLLVEIGIVAAL